MLQPDVWQHALTFLSEVDLCSIGLVNRELNAWTAHDLLWKPHCDRQWDGKQGEALVSMRDTNSSNDDTDGGRENCYVNNTAEPSVSWWWFMRHNALGYGRPSDTTDCNRSPSTSSLSSLSWKQRYASVAKDALRNNITREEVCYYSWKLLYNNSGESNLGLRKFLKDGTYHSPYFGVCEWALSASGDMLLLMGMRLSVDRDPETWGWIIGKGTSTVYVSVDVASSAE